MKRTVKGALALLLAAVFLCGNALAAGETYSFEEFDFEVTVPEEDYYILTRDMDPDSPTLVDVGLTVEQVNEILEPNNIYLDALYYDASYELAVVVLEGEDYGSVFNYDLLSKLERNAIASEAKRELERQGYTVTGDISWYEGEETVFVVLEMELPDSAGWSYQYQAVYNGRMVAVGASSVYLEEPTDEIKEQTRLLAEGIHFTRRLPTPQEVLDAYEEDEKGSTLLPSILKGAIVGALIGVGYEVFSKLRKKKKEKENADELPAENEASTGGNDL